MWKRITVVAGGMALAVALPFVALAVTTDEFPDVMPADAAPAAEQAAIRTQSIADVPLAEPTGPWVSPNAVDPVAIEQADQTMVRQQLRVHAETGPPEGFEPVQQRLHADDPLGVGPGNNDAGRGQNMQNRQNQELVRGTPDAPRVEVGTGECPDDGIDCPNADSPDRAMNQNQNQNEEMVKGNPDAPMASAGTGDPEDCPHEGQPQGGQGGGSGGRNG
jgi:hypothetical protein